MTGERERVYYLEVRPLKSTRASYIAFALAKIEILGLLDGQCFLTYAKLDVFVGANVNGYVVAR